MARRNESPGERDRRRVAARRPDAPSPGSLEVVSTEVTTTWLGPIPPPDMLQRFDEVVPGAAERILETAEKQADHRMRMEETVIEGDSTRSYLGLIAGFILSAGTIAGGIFLIMNGHDWAGGLLVGVNLVGLAGVFVYGTNSRRVERERKAERMQRPR